MQVLNAQTANIRWPKMVATSVFAKIKNGTVLNTAANPNARAVRLEKMSASLASIITISGRAPRPATSPTAKTVRNNTTKKPASPVSANLATGSAHQETAMMSRVRVPKEKSALQAMVVIDVDAKTRHGCAPKNSAQGTRAWTGTAACPSMAAMSACVKMGAGNVRKRFALKQRARRASK